MKNLMFLILLTTLMLPLSAQARQARGGFVDNSGRVEYTQVSEVENLADDSYVTLKGNITAKLGDEKYSFKDATGTITVEIDDDNWDGLTIKPGDTVILEGEVDKSWTRPAEIEVDVVRLAD